MGKIVIDSNKQPKYKNLGDLLAAIEEAIYEAMEDVGRKNPPKIFYIDNSIDSENPDH